MAVFPEGRALAIIPASILSIGHTLTKLPSSPERFTQLDGLRGLAAVIVVISHSANDGLLPSILGHGLGQIGVTMFYALSAFLLGHLYIRTDFSSKSLKRYTVSRVSRVLPLFYSVIAVALLIFLVFGKTFYDIETLSGFIPNAALIQGSSVLWSIPVELHYYLVFAGLWWLYARHQFSIWWIVAIALAVQATAAVLIKLTFPQAGSFNLAFWGHIFLCGLLLSQIKHTKLSGRAASLQALALSVAFILSLPEVRRRIGIPTLPSYADPLTAGLPVLVLYLALRNAAPLQFLRSSFLCFLGSISFGLYLIHLPVISLVKKFDVHTLAPGFGFAVVLALSLFLSWCARHIIEIPAQRSMKSYFSGQKKLA